MKLLIIVGKVWPQPGNNTNLMMKLLPYLEEHAEIRLLSAGSPEGQPEQLILPDGHPITISEEKDCSAAQRFVYKICASVVDRKGLSDARTSLVLRSAAKRIHQSFPFDALLVCVEPFSAACIIPLMNRDIKTSVYFMDPTIYTRKKLRFRRKMMQRILASADLILTTPFILKAMEQANLKVKCEHIATVGFPMIAENHAAGKKRNDGKIRLLYCGWLYSDIRSPQYFLGIVSRLDERFKVTFMGKECELLQERFPTKSKATLITLPNQPYEVALQAMADADVLINIGNSVPVHMPSKTLEYINTGKPMVNFYKFSDCPTLYYTKRYPLALNLFEEEKDMDAAASRFVRFCEETAGKKVDHDWIEAEYADCTPRYIAQKIIESLEK